MFVDRWLCFSEFCLVKEHGLYGIPTLSSALQGNELFPESSSVFNIGDMFWRTCLKISPSIWLYLTSLRSSAMGRTFKCSQNMFCKEATRRRNDVPKNKSLTHHSAFVVVCSRQMKTSNPQTQVWPTSYGLTWEVSFRSAYTDLLRALRVCSGDWWWPRADRVAGVLLLVTLPSFLLTCFNPVLPSL